MRAPKENPVTTMFMAGFGIFIFAAYLLVVQPAKAEQERVVRNMCGEPVSYSEDNVSTKSNNQNKPIYERTILDN